MDSEAGINPNITTAILKVRNGTHRKSPASVSDYTQRQGIRGLFLYKIAKLVLIPTHRT